MALPEATSKFASQQSINSFIYSHEKPNSSLEVLVGPWNRDQEALRECAKFGLHNPLPENPNGVYCAVSLTGTPPQAKEYVKRIQSLTKQIAVSAGLDSYDPQTASFSPDLGLEAPPEEVTKEDLKRIMAARFLICHPTIASTGAGIEMQAALAMGKIPIIMHNSQLRDTRMQVGGIHLQYDGIEGLEAKQARFAQLLAFLASYTPGIGVLSEPDVEKPEDKKRTVILGFNIQQGTIIDLNKLTEQMFPDLIYRYNPQSPTLQTAVTDPEQLYGEQYDTTALNSLLS